MREQIGIDVTARDLASKELQRVNGAVDRLATSTGQAVPKTDALSGAQQGLASKAFFLLQNLQSVQWAIGMVSNAMTPAVNAARDWNESVSKVNVVLGEHADVLLKAAETSARTMGLSGNQVLAMGSEYANLFRAMKLTEEQSANMSLATVQLASDISSFNNIPMDDALGKLRSGLVGEYLPLRTVGVQLNEIIVANKALEMGLKDSKAALTAQDKVMARFAIITEQLDLTVGDFARTQYGLANQQRVAAAVMDDNMKKAGQALIPVFLALTQFSIGFMEVLIPLIQIIGTQFPAVMAGFIATMILFPAVSAPATAALWGLAGAAWGALSPFLPFIAVGVAVAGLFILLEQNFGVVSGAMKVLGDAVGAVADWIKNALVVALLMIEQSPLPQILATIAGVFGVIAGVIGTVVGALASLNEKFNILGTIGEIIGTVLGKVFEAVTAPLRFIIDTLGGILDFFFDFPEGTADAANGIEEAIHGMALGVRDIGQETTEQVHATEAESRAIIARAIPGMENISNDYFNALPDAAGNAQQEVLKLTSETMTGVADSIKAGRTGVKSAVDAFRDALKNAVPPAKEKKDIEKFLASKELKAGLASQNAEIRAYAEAAQKTAQERLFALTNNVAGVALDNQVTYNDAYKTVAEEKAKEMYEAAKAAQDAQAKQLEHNMFRWGERTMEAFGEGMTSAKDDVKRHLRGVMADLVPVVEANSPPGVQSPLHKIDDWGARTVTAFGDGMRKAGAALRQSASLAVGATRPEFDGVAALGVSNAAASAGGSVVINNNFTPGSVRKDEDIRHITERIHTQARLRGGLHGGGAAATTL